SVGFPRPGPRSVEAANLPRAFSLLVPGHEVFFLHGEGGTGADWRFRMALQAFGVRLSASTMHVSAGQLPALKPKGKLRHAVEIRHDSFVDPHKLLRKYRVGLVVADTVEWSLLMDVASDFIYCRLHG